MTLRCRWCHTLVDDAQWTRHAIQVHQFKNLPHLDVLFDEVEEPMIPIPAPNPYFEPKPRRSFWKVAFASLAGSAILWLVLYLYLAVL